MLFNNFWDCFFCFIQPLTFPSLSFATHLVIWRANGFSSADEQKVYLLNSMESTSNWRYHDMAFITEKIMTKHRHDLSTPAVGFFLIIILISKYAATGDVLYRFEMGVAYPAIFVLMGYNLRFPKNWRKFVEQTWREFLILIVPSYISYFFLQLYIDTHRMNHLLSFPKKFIIYVFYK